MNVTKPIELAMFVGLPYIALALLVVVGATRYFRRPFSVSSLSSQFLENRKHFWALVPFHYGILWVLAGHIVALFIPRGIMLWNGAPLRLFALEISGFAAALLALVGLCALMVRRADTERVRVVTTRVDWLLYVVLLVQIISGLFVAAFYQWGSSWYATVAVPYIWSLLTLRPEIEPLLALPWLVKVHIVNAWLFIALFPFTRMMHAMVAPLPYLWRRPQVVRWHK